MAKNRTMRVAVLMLALTLITSCFVGGTFAKYTTKGGAEDTARVAKWGVEIFAKEGGSVFADTYQASKGSTATGIVVKAEEKVVAPGTSSEEVNNTLYFGVTGTPEVKTQIKTDFRGTTIYVGEYEPIVFTLYILDNDAKIDDPENADWSSAVTVTGDFDTIKEAISKYASFTCEAGDTLDALFKLEWTWDFDDNGAGTNDVNDTLLGDLAAENGAYVDPTNPSLPFSTLLQYYVTVTVEQVD